MSKIKELFGVEIGEKFRLRMGSMMCAGEYYFDGYNNLIFFQTNTVSARTPLDILTGELTIVKIKTPILTPDERDYLQAVCNSKFYQGKILSFVKDRVLGTSLYNIEINTDLADVDCCLFSFEKGIEIFKGMELDKHYTPEQLGIKL